VSIKRLGKGLDALIRSNEVKNKDDSGIQKKGAGSISKIRLKLIHPNPNQPRKYFDEAALNELTASISEKGLISPLTVREVESGYELIAGERRWRALKYLKKRTAPAYVLNTKDDSDVMEMALIENLQREDLNAVEEAEAYAVLNKKYNLSHEEIAKAVGKKRVTISNALRLLKLPFDIRKSLIDRKISAGHARAILQAKTTSTMIKVWEVIIKKNLSVRDAEILVKGKKINLPNNVGILKNKDPRLIPLENKLIEILGTKVKLKSSKKGGKIEISYYSADDLDRILDIISD
tara:strand:+ start:738 stop:1613 length:876 start_codon:yes stop_codon:yes gene_type:complete